MIMSTTQISIPLPGLPEGWTAEKDFKAIGSLTPATKRNVEPVGRHFLAYARRVNFFFHSSHIPSSTSGERETDQYDLSSIV